MYFRILHDSNSGEFSYLLADHTQDAVLIDPHARDIAVLSALLSEQNLQLRWVLRTHHHDALHAHESALLAELGAPVVQGDVADTELPFGDGVIQVVATPGHTRTCLSFAWHDRFFCGGLLAVTACPHQAYPQAPEALWDSVMQKVFTLADETLLFAGHDHHTRAVSTVLEQRRWHPYFSGLTRDEFLAQMDVLSQRPVPPPFFEE